MSRRRTRPKVPKCVLCKRRPRKRRHFKCSACIQKAWRRKHPIRAAWHSIKQRARRKKLEFDLPFPLFRELALVAGYGGHGNGHMHCDRKDATKGYTLRNIRFIPCGDNWAKGNRERHLPEHVLEMLRRKGLTIEAVVCETHDVEVDGECPF